MLEMKKKRPRLSSPPVVASLALHHERVSLIEGASILFFDRTEVVFAHSAFVHFAAVHLDFSTAPVVDFLLHVRILIRVHALRRHGSKFNWVGYAARDFDQKLVGPDTFRVQVGGNFVARALVYRDKVAVLP